jgi:hypothetical protein
VLRVATVSYDHSLFLIASDNHSYSDPDFLSYKKPCKNGQNNAKKHFFANNYEHFNVFFAVFYSKFDTNAKYKTVIVNTDYFQVVMIDTKIGIFDHL